LSDLCAIKHDNRRTERQQGRRCYRKKGEVEEQMREGERWSLENEKGKEKEKDHKDKEGELVRRWRGQRRSRMRRTKRRRKKRKKQQTQQCDHHISV